MAGQQGTIDAHFHELLTSLRTQLNLQEIRRKLRAGALATFNLDVARVVAEYAGRLAGVLPPPAGLALQSVLFLVEAPLQAHDNAAAAASVRDKLRHVEERLHRLQDLGSLPDNIQDDIDRITKELLLLSVVVHDLQRRPLSGWRKCTSCLHSLLCVKCNAQKLKDVAANLSTVLTRISLTLDQIVAHRIERPAESAPELPAHLDGGMDQRVSKVMAFLRTNTSVNKSVRVVGLYGEGGIGKTTLMHAIHDQLKQKHGTVPQLHKIAFVEVGREPPPPTQLQQSLFSQLSGGNKLVFSSTAQGRSELEGLLGKLRSERMPVCILLDNVWEKSHLKELLPRKLAGVLPGGSYMVITSRSAEVVRRLGQMCFESKDEEKQGYRDYQLELLDEKDAVTFLETASRQGERRPLLRGDELVKAVVPLCGRLPLALAVYGAVFKDESKREPHVWRSVCNKLSSAQDLPSGDDKVFEKLRLSIDIQSEELKDAFLDVALFFNHHRDFDLDTIKYAMEEEDYLDSLVEQSLVRVRGDQVVVHDLLVLVAQQMAKDRSIAILAPTFKHEPWQDRRQVRYFDLQTWPKDNYPSTSQMEACRYLLLKDADSKAFRGDYVPQMIDSEDFRVNYFLPTIIKHCHNIRLLVLGKDFLYEPHFFEEQVFPWIANLTKLIVLFLSGATAFHTTSTLKVVMQSMTEKMFVC